jgi:hypothetical protein
MALEGTLFATTPEVVGSDDDAGTVLANAEAGNPPKVCAFAASIA